MGKASREVRLKAQRKHYDKTMGTEEGRERLAAKARANYAKRMQCPEYRARRNAQMKANLRAKKLEAIEYLGGKCKDCGGKFHHSVYDFHHLDPNEKDINPSAAFSRKNWKSEIDKCVLLCANCHRLRHWGGNDDIN